MSFDDRASDRPRSSGGVSVTGKRTNDRPLDQDVP
jgi:hypothetical protein